MRYKEDFDENIFYGHLVKGKLNDAVKYLKQFKSKSDLYEKYLNLFGRENYLTYDTDEYLNEILLIYQKYYREVFYLEVSALQAEKRMAERFSGFFRIDGETPDVGEIEKNYVAEAFGKKSYKFLGGRTDGYYGPYIWKETETEKYSVGLPDGNRVYGINFLSGFISKSWIDYISFGAIGTGGWTDGNGVINCDKSAYDLRDESFTVSLLKHEAQHADDLARCPAMSSADLEYRAKLVELIYSEKRNLLKRFIGEADGANGQNGHSLAAERIAEEFKSIAGEKLTDLTVGEVRSIAKKLFKESDREIAKKYS